MTEFEKRYIYVCEKLKKYCVPYETNLKKIRIGNDRDGGYVVSELPGYDALYSYGCDDKTSFERAFYDVYKKDSYVYDHTIEGITDKPDYIHFFKQGVDSSKSEMMDTIDNHILANGHEKSTNLMAQIDIEGHEWKLFHDGAEFMKNFSQIVIEFHIFGNVVNYEDYIDRTFKKLNEHYVCTHIHGQNSPLNPWLDGNFPKVFEMTWVRKDFVKEKKVEPGVFPVKGLDYAGDEKRADLRLDYWHDLKDTSYLGFDK